ncbi:NAD(P)H-binding protein [Alishewanella sp. HL-SH05]|uniref:NAD(P)H-binding protein n=1 Tax=Alishewanella sp. HL-SH05 TaxID=3461145 RepID=UPI0040438A25
MTNKVVIIGCGWLGQQLAKPLVHAGYQVFGSRQSSASAAALPEPIQGFTLALNQPLVEIDKLLAMLADAWVICSIAPGRSSPTGYVSALQQLAKLCQQAGFRGGIHFSSTGVYQGVDGQLNEQAALSDTQPRAVLLAEGEQALQQQGNWLTLRLGGLMGPGRHPARFTQGKRLADAQQPVNMLHSAEVVQAVLALLPVWPLSQPCYNLSSPALVSKQAFYHAATAALGLPDSAFDTETAAPWRKVESLAIERDTPFRYRYRDARDALADCL